MRYIGVALFAMLASPVFAQWQTIMDASTFENQVVGNGYADDSGNWFRFEADGRLSGGSNGKALAGSWTFEGGFVCFERTLGGERLPADCISVLVDGNQLVTIRNRGRGRQTQYIKQ